MWGGAKSVIASAGHDVIWAGDLNQDPVDEEILAIAHRDGRTLVTLDKDFGELAILRNYPHHGIIRLIGFAARQQASACIDILNRFSEEVSAGAIVTASPDRARIRPRMRTDLP